MKKLRVCLIGAAQLFTGAAAADPYPFSGFFALERPGFGEVSCAFDILRQSESGEFSGYLLDKPHWEAQGKARFLRYKHGTCTFDAATAVDKCVTHVNHVRDATNAVARQRVGDGSERRCRVHADARRGR